MDRKKDQLCYELYNGVGQTPHLRRLTPMLTTRKGRADGSALIIAMHRHAEALDKFRQAFYGLDYEDWLHAALEVMATNQTRQSRRRSQRAA